MRFKKAVAALVVAVSTAAGTAAMANAANEAPPTPKFLRAPCEQEDTVNRNCYWNDGSGHAFLVIRYSQCGAIRRFIDRRYGRHHDEQFNICNPR